MKTIYALGCPSSIGGAETELWHTVRLWRRSGRPVTLLTTGPCDPYWKARCEAIGCKFHGLKFDAKAIPPEVEGQPVVAFCNRAFMWIAEELRKAKAKLVWVPCMMHPWEVEHKVCQRIGPFDAYVMQTQFQFDELLKWHRAWGVPEDRRWRIRGAFDMSEFAYAPKPWMIGRPFVIGHLSRPHPRKWRKDIWAIYKAIRDRLAPDLPVQVRVMGWTYEATRIQTGDPPKGMEVEILPPGKEDCQTFLQSIHALVQYSDCDENWPRVGLEAMACGTLLVVERRGGWIEMMRDAHSGFFASPNEAAETVAMIAPRERKRMKIVEQAQTHCRDLTDPDEITGRWETLWQQLEVV